MLLMTLWRLLTLLGRNLEEEEKGRATAFNVVLAFFALRYYSVVPNLFTELNIETLKGSKTFISSNVFFNPIQQVIRSRNAAIIKKHFRSQVCDLWSICVRARALICSLDLWRRMLFHGVFFLKAYRWFVFRQIKTLLCLHRKEVKWKLAFLFGLQDVSTHIQAVLEVDRSSKFCCRTNRRWKTDRESRHPNRIVPFHPHIRPSKTGY